MPGWEDRRVWLRALEDAPFEGCATPLETALHEAQIFNRVMHQRNNQADRQGKHQEKNQAYDQIRGGAVRVITDSICAPDAEASGCVPEEAYVLTRNGDTVEVRGGRVGILYGTYAAMEAVLCGDAPLCGEVPQCEDASLCGDAPLSPGKEMHIPHYSLRMLDAWDNMDGSIERGYAGRSIWFEKGRFSYDRRRIRQLGRMLASAGINVLCINNVNVHAPAQSLGDGLLEETAAFAKLLRPFGVRLMLSIDFSLPLQRGLDTADPDSDAVGAWWKEFADRLWAAVPDLAGFLVKADSEHRPGPNAYGRDHAQGANMLARAVRPHGGVVVWRAFVYNCEQDWRDAGTDRPCAAYDAYLPLDGAFDKNVILQIKYGPFDFQVREPLSPLFFAMKRTGMAVELQLAQEYTGQQIDLFAMPPMWKEIFDGLSRGGAEGIRAAAAVSNLGRDDCWTGHPFAALNLYAYGRFAWKPDSDPESVTRRWIRLTYDLPPAQEDALAGLLLASRSVYEQYAGSLGLCWMVRPETHYGPSPYGYEFDVWGTYNRADREAVGVDRTKKGTGLASQYPPELAQRYSDSQACPEELLLFFHRLPYTYRMRDGRSLIQRLYDDHFEGYDKTVRMQSVLEAMDLPEADAAEVKERMRLQVQNAREWRDVINTFFHRFSGIADERGRKIYP